MLKFWMLMIGFIYLQDNPEEKYYHFDIEGENLDEFCSIKSEQM